MPSTSRTCFDFAIDFLYWLEEIVHGFSYNFNSLKTDVRLLKTFVMCARKWKGSKILYLGYLLSSIQHLVSSITSHIHSAYLTSGPVGADIEVTRFRENIELLGTDMKELYIIFLEDHHYPLGDPVADQPRLMDLIDSLLKVLPRIIWHYHVIEEALHDQLKALEEMIMFLKNFICFATMQLQDGVEHMQLIHLLIHAEFVALNAARLIHMCWFDKYDMLVLKKMKFELSQLLQTKLSPADLDPQVRETYIHVLTVSKLSTSSAHFHTREKNWLAVAADFVDSLLGNVWNLLDRDTTGFIISVKNQMHILYEAVRFLRNLLKEQQEKFNELQDEMKDLVRVVVCDAGIVICSLSLNQMKGGLAKEIDIVLFHLLNVLKFIMVEAEQIYPPTSSSSFSFPSFPRTNVLGSLDFILQNLKEQASCEADSIVFMEDQIHTVQEDLSSLRSFLQNVTEQRNKDEKLQVLYRRVMEVAHKAEFVIDSILVGDKPDCSSLSLDTIIEEIKFIKTEAPEIHDSVRHDNQDHRFAKTSTHLPSQVSTPGFGAFLVGLDDEVNTIINGLTRGSTQLDIVSIVGMPGLGKTTLANRVYNDPSIMFHFHTRAWCTVSQVYSKHTLLLKILGDSVSKSSGKSHNMNEDDLSEELYKRLKGKRYLIVLDDMWDIEALNLLKVSFPNDELGSRILFTSRSHILCSQFRFDSKPHHLRLLTDEESWELLQSKLFSKANCPPALSVVGKQIAKECKGLPLTVVIVAGILSCIEQDCWEEVANSLSSSTVLETEYCMQTLDLSYRYLPDYLKPCLLYFSAFQEDQDIPVQKLKLLWISEGFVQKTQTKSLEDTADEYLMDLIGRSLIMVTQQRSTGGAKACQIHDLLHEFCVEKAKEESFLQIFDGHNELFTSTRLYNPHRLFICSITREKLAKSRLFFPHLRSLLFSPGDSLYFAAEHGYSFIFRLSKLLRVLDFGEVHLGHKFPRGVELLVHLRYLAIQCDLQSIPPGIARLSRLETFLMVGNSTDIALPNTIWNLKKLRHLYARSRFGSGPIGFILPNDDLDSSADLYHLETITLAIDPSWQNMQQIMRKLPSIRRLKCVDITSRKSTGNCNGILVLQFLSRLESVHVVGFRGFELVFPLNLKKLTLSHYNQPWSTISTIGKLPNLEVLKLGPNAFSGETWEMIEGEFPKLGVLKLAYSDIVRWTDSCDNFPPLQKLVLHDCWKLEEVPPCLGDIPTLEMIEVRRCHQSTVSLVKQIQKEQMDMGNESLKMVIQEED